MYAIKRAANGTGKAEVHILSGATRFGTFGLQVGTALHMVGDKMRGSLYWHIDAVLGALSQTWQDGVGVGERLKPAPLLEM